MVHGNLCDKPQDRFEFFPFTNNIQALVQFLQKRFGAQGGVIEASYEQCLKTAAEFEWQDDATKILIMIGDQTPCTKQQYDFEGIPYIDWK